MTKPRLFAELLDSYIQRDGRHVRQLSQASGDQFGLAHLVPHNTISRWLRGEVKKPRNWPDIVKLCAVMRLPAADLQQLLQAAGHDGSSLLSKEPPIPGLFDLWQRPSQDGLQPFQAPAQLSTFIGREVEGRTLSRVLCSQAERRLCCLLGMAGLGKTSLATHLAYQLRDQFADGVLWVNLEQTEPMAALKAIAAAYGDDIGDNDLGMRSSKVRALLATKEALLVLDNARHDAEIRPLLPPDGRCTVLIISQHHDLAVTDSAYRLHLQSFAAHQGESLALFKSILGDKQVTAEAQLYQQIADLLGHLPLALNIIANRLKYEPGWTVAQLLARLQQAEQRLNLLGRGDQQVRRSFALSFDTLDVRDQHLFALLGIFPDTFQAALVAEMAQQPLWALEDSLRRLVNQSFLHSTPKGRYELHPLLRDFSREQVQPEGLPKRFVGLFTTLAQTQAQNEALLDEEIGNIVTAVTMAQQLGMDDCVVTAVNAIYPYLQRKGQLDRATELLKLAEQTARANGNLTGLTHILHFSGYTAMKQGQPQQAQSYYQEALTLAQQTGDKGQTAEILLKLGALAYRRGRLEEAQQFYEEALVLARKQQDLTLIASLLTNLGLVEAASGGLTAAIALYQEALPLAKEARDIALTSNILQNLGDMLAERGDYAQAKECFEKGLGLAKKQNDPELRSRMVGNLGSVACQLGNYAEAAAHFRSGLTLAEGNGLTIQIYRQQANLGHVATLRGQYRQANTHYQEALTIARTLAFPEDLSMILNQAGDCYLAQDALKEAAECFDEALEIARADQLRRVEPLTLFGLARVAALRGNVVEARRLGLESRQQLLAIGHHKTSEVWWWLQELPSKETPN